MKFRNEGIAFAHLTLPPDSFADEADALASALKNLGKNYAQNEIAYLTGQSDLLLELHLSDLRLAFLLRYDSKATGTNWLFTAPYEHAVHNGTASDELAFKYVTHLRVNRDLYRAAGATVDEQIIADILRLATGKLSAEISAGFGWSDLIVSGVFTKRRDFIDFLSGLHHLRSTAGSQPDDAFRRILTIIGYDTRTKFSHVESQEVVHPIIFARTLPTHIGDAADFIAWKKGGSWRKVVVDGKWDLIIFLNSLEGVPAKGFLEHHHRLITGGGLRAAGIQRLETHLLSQEAPERETAPTAPHTPPQPCAFCSSAVQSEFALLGSPEVKGSPANLLPRSLVIAIRNVLNLFHTASREGTTCCDIVPSLVRCEIGLDRLLRHYQSLHQRMNDVASIDVALASPSASQWSPHVVKARNDIEAWCTYAERIVSQRTVGRFEEFLAQNERVVSYRGGIQKLLYLADALLNSYARRIYTASDEPAFMSLYDPIDLVESMRVVGFVRVPVRYVFILPLAITHLWHEVGVHWFYSKYLNPVDSRSRNRAFALFEAANDMDNSPEKQRFDLLFDLADVYGDAVTLVKGFRGDVPKFVVSLSGTLLEANAFRSAPRPVQETFLVQLLVRLYLAEEFWERCKFVRRKLRSHAVTVDRVELENWTPDSKFFIAPTIAQIAAILRRELLTHERYKNVEISPALEEAAVRAVGKVAAAVHRRYLSELAWEVAPGTVEQISRASIDACERIMHGEVLQLEEQVDLNDLFLLVQQRLIHALRRRPYSEHGIVTGEDSFIGPVAALTRSSLLAFYKRDRFESPGKRTTLEELRKSYTGPPPTDAEHDLFGDEDVNA